MRWLRLVPVLVGIGILLFGIYLVTTNGYVGSTYLPSIIGIHPCSSTSNSSLPSSGCDFSYLGYGVGTLVCLFGLGIVASAARRFASSGASGQPTLSPEVLAAMAQAQARMGATTGPIVPGARPGTVYCSNCGAANPSGAKFCHQCASPVAPAPAPSLPSAPPPGATG